MLLRFVVMAVLVWVLLTMVRTAMEAATQANPGSRRPPRGPGYRRPPASAGDRRRAALSVLGLYEGAKPAEIKKAYRELAATYHPDRVAHLGPELVELTSEKFKEITAAYEYLTSSPSSR